MPNIIMPDSVEGLELASKLDIRTNATLRKDEWKKIDDNLLVIARQRLTAVQDLISAGLTVDLGGLGVTISEYERSGDLINAEVSMDGITRVTKDRPTFDLVGVPVPIVSRDFSYNLRQLEASRSRGQSLDTTTSDMAQRKVMDALESMVYVGFPGLVVDSKQIYGYTTHPQRNTVTLAGTGWAVESGRDIIGDTQNMLAAMNAVNRYGPFTMYVSKDYWVPLQGDYSAAKGDKTFKQRIEDFADIVAVKAGNALPANTVILVQLTSENVDLAIGKDITNLEWEPQPMLSNFKTFAAMAIRIKADKNNTTGIVHGSV